MTATDELDALAKLVLRVSSQAMCWPEFFCPVQAPGETVSERCGFHCPSCASDLSDNMLQQKLMSGLREVFQACDMLTRIDRLRTYCVAFETLSEILWEVQTRAKPPWRPLTSRMTSMRMTTSSQQLA